MKLKLKIFFLVLLFGCSKNRSTEVKNSPIYSLPQKIALNLKTGYVKNSFSGETITPIINSLGDTLITGKFIPSQGKIVNKDSLIKPIVKRVNDFPKNILISNISRVNPEISNSFEFKFSSETRCLNDFVLVNTTGKTIPTNKKIPINGKKVACKFPQPKEILFPQMKDKATHNIQYLDVEQGLNASYNYTILEDRFGNLWFDSWGGGVSRYDGKYLTSFTKSNGLSENNVYSIIEDRKGNLWFATYGGGVNKFDGKSFTHYTENEGLSNNRVWSLLEDKEGNIWIGTDGGGVSKFDGKNIIHYTTKEGLAHNIVYKIFQDKENNIWFCTQGGGVSKYDGKNFYNFSESDGLNNNNVWSILEDRNGVIWLGTNEGVCRIEGKEYSIINEENGLANNMVYSIVEDKNGDILFGTYGGGLSIYNGKTFETYSVNEGLSNDYVRFIYEDKSENIWLSTDGGGINKLKRKSFKHITVADGIIDNYVNVVIEDSKKQKWFGTYGGVSVLNGKSIYQITEEAGLQNNYVRTILEDSKGNIWIGADANGVSKYDGKSFTYYTTKEGLSYDIIYSIIEDKEGSIWIGTYGGGITKFDGNNFTHFSEKEGLSNNYIYNMLSDKNGNIWIATWGGGISKFDGNGFIHYTAKEGLTDNNVNALMEDRDGNIWIGTNFGLNLFDVKSFIHYSTNEGLCNNVIYAMAQDSSGGVWVTTEKGLSYLVNENSDAKNNFKVKLSYLKQDGLKGIDFCANSINIDHANVMWLGSGKSLESLNLNNYHGSNNTLNPKLKQVLINENHLDYRNLPDSLKNVFSFSTVENFENFPHDLVLPHYLNHLTFQFSAIDWAAPHKIKYQYKIEGLDEKWNPVTEQTVADYRNIPYGKYIFKVRAIGESQIWSEPYEYSFEILPPWWKTTWFRVLAVFFILVVLYLLYRWRTATMRKRQQQLEITVEQRTAEVVHQKEMVEEKHKEITDSINYAKRLQQAILATQEEIDKHIPNNFLLYKPKDIVAGDFYFFETTNDFIFYAAADCTGHGVPGAMLSIVCSNALSRSVKEFDLTDPSEILDKTRELILETFMKSIHDVKDGMDISFLSINKNTKELKWAGANNPIWYLENGELKEIKGDKQPIGKSDHPKPFTTHTLPQSLSTLYLFTDGYADQFGGPNGKKFKYSNLQKMLLENSEKLFAEQFQILENNFVAWKGELEQLDDVCIIGIRI